MKLTAEEQRVTNELVEIISAMQDRLKVRFSNKDLDLIIRYLFDGFSPRYIELACLVTIYHQCRMEYGYCRSVLEDWQRQGLKTADDVLAHYQSIEETTDPEEEAAAKLFWRLHCATYDGRDLIEELTAK